MIKKYGILGAVSLLVLTGCTNNSTPTDNTRVENNTSNLENTNENTQINSENTTGEDNANTGNTQNEISSGSLNQLTGESSIATGTSSSEKEYPINASYKNPAGEVTINGKMVVENGIIKSIEIVDPQGPVEAFAKAAPEKIIGKPLSGLQVDTVTGASLTTAAFNEYLKNLNK